MKLVPPFILDRSVDPDLPKVSMGEQTVFRSLQAINLTQYDIALHSLNMTRHRHKRWSEMDFLIISLRGLLVVEVKGGPVSCKDGIWSYSGGKKKLSPAAQVKENYFTLMGEYLAPRFSRNLDKTVSGFACIFTDTPRLVGVDESALCEQGDEITCYEQEASTPKSLKEFFNRVFAYWESKGNHQNRGLEQREVDAIANFLRPEFERAPSLNSCLRAARASFQKLTKEQYGHLDMLQGIERYMLEGGAGTGKSFLAIYAARCHAPARKVLFVTRNPSFASYAKLELASSGVDVMSLAELATAFTDRWEKVDVLIMDEAQDLCTWDAVSILDKALIGGLSDGQWAWFGDSNRQVSPSVKFDPEVYDYFRSSAVHVPPPLKKNVRNTPEVVRAIKFLAGADTGTAPDKGIGQQLMVGQSEDVPAAIAEARGKLQGFLSEGLEVSEIVFLCPAQDDLKVCERILKQSGVDWSTVNEKDFEYGSHRDEALVGTVEAYKGLERPVVFLLCFWAFADAESRDKLRSLFYKAVSRANHTVFVAADRKLRAAIQELMAENLAELGS
jgi:hypothetical protein